MQSRPDMYMRDGKPDEDLARDGILGVAVPGEIAGIDAALKRFGTMKFQQIAAPADKLAATATSRVRIWRRKSRCSRRS